MAEGGIEGRKLGAPELKARRESVLNKLKGLTITPELDVSDSLSQECVSISEKNRLRYIPWELCTARSLEVVGVKTDQTWVKDANGFLKSVDIGGDPDRADCSSELLLDYALRRRGLALAMGDLMG